MSFQAMTWAVKQKAGNATAKCLLLAIANYADEEGRCWPSQSQLAKDCECSERTIGRIISDMEKRGILKRERRHRGNGSRTSDIIHLNLTDNLSPDTMSPDTVSSLTDTMSPPEPVTEPINSSFSERVRENPPDDAFEQFWATYPNQVQIASARQAFTFALLKADFTAIMDGVRRYRSKQDTRPWMNPARWLSEECWLDNPAQVNPRGHSPPHRQPNDAELILNGALERGYKGEPDDGQNNDFGGHGGGNVLALPSR